MRSTNLKPSVYLFIIVLLSSLMLFWEIGQHDVASYDEARNGVNAWNMYHNHDYVNYYYGNEIDSWNAKPPLMIWLITISYKLFGFNEFALRFPAVISTILFFIVLFQLIRLFEPPVKAFLTCIILLGCRAVIAHHVGRTGDFDALLLLLLTCSVYFFVRYLYYSEKSGIYWAALFTGLAFYTKGTAALLYAPGMFLFLLVTRQLKQLFGNYRLYIAVAIFFAIVASWVLLVYKYSKMPEDSFYGSSNSIETMLIHDTYKRLASSDFKSGAFRDNFFFFHTIEVRMNMWHFLFYLGIVTGIIQLILKRHRLKEIIGAKNNRLTILSLCLATPVILVVNFSEHPLDWYLAPAWPFIAFITAQTMLYYSTKWKPLRYVWIAVIGFNLLKHFMFIDGHKEEMHHALNKQNPLLDNIDYVVVQHTPRQNIMLYLHWLNLDFYKVDSNNQLQQQKGRIAIVNDSNLDPEHFDPLEHFDEYYLARIK